MTARLWIVCWGLCVVLNAGCGSQPTPTPIPALIPTPDPFRVYAHPEGLWRISFPPSWHVDIGTRDVVRFIPPKAQAQRHPIQVFVSRGELGASVGVDDVETFSSKWLAEEQTADGISDFTVTSWKQVKVAERSAYEAMFSYGKDDFYSAWIQLHLVIGRDSYRVAGWAPLERWHEAESLLRRLVYSFQPLSLEELPTPADTAS